ncbi:MAG TPA: glycosyltransferase family 4 protein [Dehalococcoidia bacterium]|jgi:glycosyltransferase involved in cell wall biosynthesis
MRILQIAPVWECVPPPGYGGTEAVVALLTDELVARGHDVTLAASGDSVTTATLRAPFPRSLRRAENLKDRTPYDWAHLAHALHDAGDFDVVHNHAGEFAMAMAGLVDAPFLTTMHNFPTAETRCIWNRYAGAYNTISQAQNRVFQPLSGPAVYAGHVYNAIDVESFPFEPKKSDDLLFLSRVAREKGPEIAVEVAKRTGRRLIIAGKVDHYDGDFFDEVMRPLIDDDQIVFVGEADAVRKRELYRRAKCLLLPLQWDEPFGLVMPEAMACGTPVVAFPRGSAREVVDHGRTGFIVENLDEMVEAVNMIEAIDPADCRRHVAANFAPALMTDGYLRMYHRVLELGPRGSPARAARGRAAGAVEPLAVR